MRKPFNLPENECERATRDEMSAIRMILVLASEVNYDKDDLVKRLKIIPDGEARMNQVSIDITELFRDIVGTITHKQRKALQNSASDYDIQLVPKMMPAKTSVAVSKEDLTTLINAARQKCMYCSLGGDDVKKCDLYNLLEVLVPLNDYGSSDIICPYTYQEWM